jgi:nucleoside-diphosphate-sugar epimerase
VYSASKTLAEQALWKVVKETNPPFQVAAVLPNFNFGKILQPGGEMSASTGSSPIMLFNGNKTPFSFPPQWYVDVADDARLHVAALIDPSCNGQRIFAFAHPFNWSDVLDALRKVYPNKQFMDNIEGEGRDLSEVPNQDAEELLRKHYGKGWTSLEETLKDNTATLT